MITLRRYTPLTAATILWLAVAAGCVSTDHKAPAPGEIGDCAQFLIKADSADLRDNGTVAVVNDSTLRIRSGNTSLTLNVPRFTAGDGHGFGYVSDQPLIDMLVRLENAAPLPRSYSPTVTPYEIYLTPLETDSLFDLIFSREHEGVLLPSDNRRYDWPAVNDNGSWYMAATELCVVSGDPLKYRRVRNIARNMEPLDSTTSWDASIGLFRGTPNYMAVTPGLPDWMTPTDILQNLTLSDNIARYTAAEAMLSLDRYHGYEDPGYLPVTPDSLRRNINSRLWIPNLGYYSGMLYGSPTCPIQLNSADNLAQAMAVTSGAASLPMARTLIRRTPTPRTGIEQNTPRWSPAQTGHPHTQSFWTTACARTGNETAYRASVAALLYHCCLELTQRPSMPDSVLREQMPSRPLTAMLLRGLLGVTYSPEGMHLAPFVPESLPGTKSFTGLRYRNSTLNIRITGTGNAISTFMLDSTASEPFIPGNLSGEHQVAITLGGASADPGVANISEEPSPVCPAPPAVKWSNNHTAQISDTASTAPPEADDNNAATTPAADSYMVYIDGIISQQIFRNNYTLYDAPGYTVAQFVPMSSDNVTGFSGTPYYYMPPGQRILVFATAITKSGTRLIQDKNTAARFVELNRYRNSNLRFTVDAPQAGRYLVDVQYIDGLGIVNNKRRTAIRTLEVNGRQQGTLVFPQLTASWWNKNLGDSWQGLTGWSSAVQVQLRKGTNEMAIRFTQPSPVYLDPDNNSVLADVIRIIPFT